ncbi:MAG: PIN domain-containing protein [Rubrivivax sp.]|nr:PIN domain-containing protein [Rubrivivax sp.]
MIDATTPSAPPWVVLDTNTVLDWLVFRDSALVALAEAVTTGAVRWLACERMRQELGRVLGYPGLARWNPDRERVLASFDALTCLTAAPPTAPSPLRCTDPDDQVFIDLALAHGAKWLVSHDRAVLKLARRARPQGLWIIKPCDWKPSS